VWSSYGDEMERYSEGKKGPSRFKDRRESKVGRSPREEDYGAVGDIARGFVQAVGCYPKVGPFDSAPRMQPTVGWSLGAIRRRQSDRPSSATHLRTAVGTCLRGQETMRNSGFWNTEDTADSVTGECSGC
jgi:hypothetical protein